jgi:hypothetical protein
MFDGFTSRWIRRSGSVGRASVGGHESFGVGVVVFNSDRQKDAGRVESSVTLDLETKSRKDRWEWALRVEHLPLALSALSANLGEQSRFSGALGVGRVLNVCSCRRDREM